MRTISKETAEKEDRASDLMNKALQLAREENLSASLAKWDEAILLMSSPGMLMTALSERGSVKLRLGDYTGAFADIDRAVEIIPEEERNSKIAAMVYNHRAVASEAVSDLKSAIADYNRILQIDPEDKSVIHRRAVALAMQSSQKGREEIEAKYQAQLRAQQEQFDLNMQEQLRKQEENFKAQTEAQQKNLDAQLATALKSSENALKSSEYKKRLREYNLQLMLHGTMGWVFSLLLAVAAVAVFSYIAGRSFQVWQSTAAPFAMSSFSALSLFPFILMGTLALSPLAWIVRLLHRDKHKYWALREDAVANLTLMQIIESNLEGDAKNELWLRLFDHHDKRGSANLIADWNRADTDGGNSPGGVVRDIVNRFTPGDKSGDS